MFSQAKTGNITKMTQVNTHEHMYTHTHTMHPTLTLLAWVAQGFGNSFELF